MAEDRPEDRHAKAAERARRIGEEAGLMVDLDAPTAQLSVGEQQRLEILRVLFRGCACYAYSVVIAR